MRPGRVAITLMVTALLEGCAGQVRVNPSTRTVQAHQNHQNLLYQYGPIPPSWEPIVIEDNDAAWHDRITEGVIHVDHSCERGQDAPLSSLVQHLMMGFTEREYEIDETVPFDGREAKHVLVSARLDGVPVKLELYVMKKDNCVYDLGYVAPPEKFEQGTLPFRRFAQGFHTIPTGSPEHRLGLMGGL